MHVCIISPPLVVLLLVVSFLTELRACIAHTYATHHFIPTHTGRVHVFRAETRIRRTKRFTTVESYLFVPDQTHTHTHMYI